jgi:hypothetical protein
MVIPHQSISVFNYEGRGRVAEQFCFDLVIWKLHDPCCWQRGIQPLPKIPSAVGRIYPRQFYLGYALTAVWFKVNIRIISCRLQWGFQTNLCVGFLCGLMCATCFVHLNALFNFLQIAVLEKYVCPFSKVPNVIKIKGEVLITIFIKCHFVT